MTSGPFQQTQETAAAMVAAGSLPPDLTERAVVWQVLSEFWLDTEQLDQDFALFAQAIAATSIPAAELRRINSREVAPVVWWNVIDIAGEWVGWDPAWLLPRCARMSRRRRSPLALLGRLLRAPLVHLSTRRKVDRLALEVDALRS